MTDKPEPEPSKSEELRASVEKLIADSDRLRKLSDKVAQEAEDLSKLLPPKKESGQRGK